MTQVERAVERPTQTGALTTEFPKPLSIREKRWIPWLVLLVDALAIEVSLRAGILLRQALTPWWPIDLSSGFIARMSLVVLLVPVVYWMVGLTPGYDLNPVERLRRRVCVTLLVFSMFFGWDYLVQGNTWSRGVLLATLMFALVLSPLAESALRNILVRFRCWGTPVVLIGAAKTGVRILQNLEGHTALGLVPVGILDDDPGKWNTTVRGIPVLGPISEAGLVCQQAETAILAIPGVGGERLAELATTLPFKKVLLVPGLVGFQSLSVSSRNLGGVLSLEVRNNLLIGRIRRLKKILDLVLSTLLVLCVLPLMVLIAVAIKLSSPGPVLFSQERLGQGKRRFRILKFRTMHVGAESNFDELLARDLKLRREYQTYHKLRDDPRVTRLGRFLRMWSLDELPQFWNIICGDMSLIGPRPYMPQELPKMKGAERIILKVPPAITGLWQVTGRTTLSFEDRLEMDIYYIRSWSLWLDLYILFRTVTAVFVRRGAT